MRRKFYALLLCFATACGGSTTPGGSSSDASDVPDTMEIALAVDIVSEIDRMNPSADAAIEASADINSMDEVQPPDVVDVNDAIADVAPETTVDVAPDVPTTPVQRSCPDPTAIGCGLVAVEGGTFVMGEDLPADSTAGGFQGMAMVSPFELDRYEVTVARFRRFVEAGLPRPPPMINYPGGRRSIWSGTTVTPAHTGAELTLCNWTATPGIATQENRALNCVEWSTAQAFCIWDGGRLPTEAEWEFAARYRVAPGLDPPPRVYPTGNSTPSSATCWNARQSGPCTVDDTGSAGGIYGMAGGVWEWCADAYAPYSASCWRGADRLQNPLCDQVNAFPSYGCRGGSWSSRDPNHLRSGRHSEWQTSARDRPFTNNVGFRCARSRTPS